MKKIILSLLSLCLIVQFTTAQEQGYIKMEITEAATENADAAPFIEMMKGTQTEYFFNKETSMVKANMMGGMVEMTTIVQNESESMVLFMNAMGNKMQVESTKAERDLAEAKDGGSEMPDVDIVYDENVTKDIMGHKCVKATISMGDEENPVSMVMYVAKDLKASNKMIQGLDKVELEGFPLEYVMDAGGMKLTVTTVELKDEVSADKFEFNSRGYQKMTWEEFQSKMGAMSGGF